MSDRPPRLHERIQEEMSKHAAKEEPWGIWSTDVLGLKTRTDVSLAREVSLAHERAIILEAIAAIQNKAIEQLGGPQPTKDLKRISRALAVVLEALSMPTPPPASEDEPRWYSLMALLPADQDKGPDLSHLPENIVWAPGPCAGLSLAQGLHGQGLPDTDAHRFTILGPFA